MKMKDILNTEHEKTNRKRKCLSEKKISHVFTLYLNGAKNNFTDTHSTTSGRFWIRLTDRNKRKRKRDAKSEWN